ncbi:hypothetical protein Q4E93_20145 [Flavitalea sp. BT771]|uniref:hypothetical protein n=1 Tax=Flavitalea sp. BT771 TaxID=3063329 RepID=UPI0026E27B99|nr:hypothetical protein [Flavitalea sp. BT771]MDO6432931.1 hypothetical protein [Flavitalea sp. BT771]MDV6221793.1 hypothetical protein [Flavitalea sp. BT771]
MKLIICAILCCYCLTACVHDADTKQTSPSKSKAHESRSINSDLPINIYTAGEDRYILLDTTKIKIPIDVNITAGNIYDGIYEFKSDSLKRHKLLVTPKFAFLTVSEDLGFGPRAYLYAFDLANKSLIKDTELKHSYLYSSSGTFVIEPDSGMIFSVDREAWYDLKEKEIIPASLYVAKGGDFKYIKSVYQYGNEVPGDTSLLSFFKNSVTGSSSVFTLPDNWWKTK